MGLWNVVARRGSRRRTPALRVGILGVVLALGLSALTATAVPQRVSASPASAQPTPRPIIFLPGITGSFLSTSGGTETWPQAGNITNCVEIFPPIIGAPVGVDDSCVASDLAPNAFTSTGQPPAGNAVDVANGVQNPVDPTSGSGSTPLGGALTSIHTPGIDFGLFGEGTSHYYDITAENAAESGYTVVQDDSAGGIAACSQNPRCFVPVGLDWRRSASTNAQRVWEIVQEVRSATGSSQVDILAHSQGGLVAEALLQLPATVGKIYRVVTLGTPYLGAPKALGMLLYQEPCLTPHSWGCPLSQSVVQNLAKNYPGFAELLPDAAYLAASPTSPLIVSGGGTLSYAQYVAAVANTLAAAPLSRDDSLVTAAAQWHQTVDSWAALDPSVGLVRMVGFDAGDTGDGCTGAMPCLAQQAGSTPAGTIVSAAAGILSYGNGDGTVPFYSASLDSPWVGFDDRGNGHNMYWCGYSHMGLAQSTFVWLVAESYLEGSTDFTADSAGLGCPTGGDGSLPGLLTLPAPAATTIALSPASANPSVSGQTVTFTATVSPATATGTVAFFQAPSGTNQWRSLGSAALVGGVATLATTGLLTGNNNVYARYLGDLSDIGSTSALDSETVSQDSTTTTLTSSSGTSHGLVTTPMAFTATVAPVAPGSGEPSGFVEFLDSGLLVGGCVQAVVAGQATCSTSTLAVGTHSLQAFYLGDANFLGSSGSLSQTIDATTPTTTIVGAWPNPSTYQESVNISAAVTRTIDGHAATGNVSFYDGPTSLGTAPLTGGVATLTTSSLTGGSHSLTAVYAGDPIDVPSTSSPITQIVNRAPSTIFVRSSTNPVGTGVPATFTATVSPPQASGTITFTLDGTVPLCASVPVAAASATCAHSFPGVGTHTVVASYSGDGNFTASSSPGITQSVGVVYGITMDAYGGLHPFGNGTANTSGAPYWPGWRIARGFAESPDGSGGYTLDGWGGVHSWGAAAPVSTSAYWPGWDIARAIALNPCDSMGDSGYVLDGWGGIHPFGGAPWVTVTGYWGGWDVARGIALNPCSGGVVTGYVMDAYGGLHSFSSRARIVNPSGGAYWPGWAIARGITVTAAGQGYILDGFGGLHPFGGAPNPSPGSPYWGWDIARGITLEPSFGGGYVLDGYGGVHPFGPAPRFVTTAYWPGWDVAKSISG